MVTQPRMIFLPRRTLAHQAASIPAGPSIQRMEKGSTDTGSFPKAKIHGTRVENANRSPYNAVGCLLVNFRSGEALVGTGCLIDASHVLTCAHLFTMSPVDGDVPVSVTFFPALNQRVLASNDLAVPKLGGKTIFCPRYFVQKSASPAWEGWDVAVVRLAGQVLLKKPYFTISVTKEAEALEGRPLTLTGYTLHNFCEMYREDDQITHASIPNNIMQTTHDSSPSTSGSPLYYQDSERAYVVGVHSNEEEYQEGTFVNNCILITPSVYAFIEAAVKNPTAEFLALL